jgi:predicted DNA-binding protein with PD1-like motif
MKAVEGEAGRVIVMKLDSGEDLLETMENFIRERKINSGAFTAIGTLSGARIGVYDPATKQYAIAEMNEPLELVSCDGNIALKGEKAMIHAHIVVANKEGEAFGGHLLPGTIVGAMVEVMVTAYVNVKLRRVYDEKINLYPLVF